MLTYVAVITRENSNRFGVAFPDFPGVASAANTFDQAVDSARRSLHSHINQRCQENDTLPVPTSFADIRSSLDLQKAAVIPIQI